jgi:hypothetical protein
MSPPIMTLTMANGPLVGQAYEFRESAVYVLGRAAEYYPRLPDELRYKDITRHRCLLRVLSPGRGKDPTATGAIPPGRGWRPDGGPAMAGPGTTARGRSRRPHPSHGGGDVRPG